MAAAGTTGRVTAKVRLAGPADTDAVMALQQRLFPDDPNSLSKQDFAGDEPAILLAVEGGVVRGFAVVRARRLRPWSGLDFLGVAPDARGRGIARLLLGAAIAASGRPLLRLFVRPGNAGARTLYEKHGFHRTGTRTASYDDGEDAIVMMRWSGLRRRLPPA